MKFKFTQEQLEDLEIMLCYQRSSKLEAVNFKGEKLGFNTFDVNVKQIEKMVNDQINEGIQK